MEEMNFSDDISIRECQPKVGGVLYTLREASEEAVVKYRGSQLHNARLVDGKLQADVGKTYDSQSLLVSLCLFDKDNKPVPLSTIRTFPSRAVKEMFKWVEKASNLNELDTPEALEKRIAEDTKKLEDLKSEKDPTKN